MKYWGGRNLAAEKPKPRRIMIQSLACDVSKANRDYLRGLKGTCSLELYMSGTSAGFWNQFLDLLTCKLRRGEYV